MKKQMIRLLSCVLSVIMLVTAFSGSLQISASQQSDLQKDIADLQKQAQEIQQKINELKAEKKDQSAILSAIRSKIQNTQAQISRCNAEISAINSKIEANQAEINKKNSEIEDTKLKFKKRLRAIRMSDSESTVKVLLGAESFSDFLQLAQLTSSVSARDKKIMEELKQSIDALNKINEENNQLLKEQMAVKETISAQQAELEEQENQAAAIYNSISASQKAEESNMADVQSDIKEKQAILNNITGSNFESFINPNTGLMWPTAGRGVTSGYGSRWGSMHYGIDIAYSGIAGQPIKAIADGYVSTKSGQYFNSCTHNYKKNGSCYIDGTSKRCGGGYGNFCVINHGAITIKGSTADYAAWYAHMQTVIVSPGQKVTQGQIIGYVGCTGWSTGYHLHLGIMKNGSWIDPMTVL